jgi:hypothetical protein
VKSKNVTVAWDAPTSFLDSTPIPENMEVRYNVYIKKDTDNTHDKKELLTKKPIFETSYTIDFIERKGRYFVGIQSIADRDKDGELYNRDWTIGSQPGRSTTFERYGLFTIINVENSIYCPG